MNKFLHFVLVLSFVLLAGFVPASGQSSFMVLGDVPHLPVLDPAAISIPEAGMLIFSSTDSKPLIYTGTAWETLCTENINTTTVEEYFVVKNGIPFLPTFSTVPGGINTTGTIYYSTANNSVMVYNGSSWTKIVDMLTGTFTQNAGFIAGIGVKTFKLPVLNINPLTPGIIAGAFYINASTKVICYFDGVLWQDIRCQAVVQTLPLNSITGYTALGGGDVTTNGGYPISYTGICWSPNANPDTALTSKTILPATGTGIGIFTSQLTDLLPRTTYHVRAYAVNSQGIVYGEDLTFTTPIQRPTIITLDASNITSISVQTGGDITADGGASVTKRGIIWSAISDPLDDPTHIITNDGSGVGYYPTIVEGLLGNTNYYVRAYAVNSEGTSFGNLIKFTTPMPVPPVLNPTLTVSGITGSTTTGTALILNNGGALVTERGVCYSIDGLNFIEIPSSTVTPTDIGTFITTLTGLTQGTTYYLKGYAKNIAGTGYTSETSATTALYATITTVRPGNIAGSTATSGGVISNTGFSLITARGVCWSLDKNPTTSLITKTSNPVVGDGTGTFASQVTGLLAGTTYYIKAYAVNSAGTGYGNLDSIVMPDSARVLTLAASSLYISTATCGGDVLSDGGSVVTDRGVCWSTGVNPTIFNARTSDGDGLGIFTSYLTGLTPNVIYHFRAFAVNSIGVSYGDDLSLTVIPDAPLIITLPITEITSMSGVSGGDIKSSGGAPITLRGILWSTKGDPLTDDQAILITNDGSGVGIFPTKMDNLLGSTTYYVRAYAINSYGKAYGDLKVFTTLPPLLPVVLSPGFDIENVHNTSAVGVFLVLNNGGSPITDRGIRYSTDKSHYTYMSSETLNINDVGTYFTMLTGLQPNTTYYAQAYAINSVGTALSSEASFRTTSLAILTTTPPNRVAGFTAYSGGEITSTGDDIISAKGICWSPDSIPKFNLATKTSEVVSGIGAGVFISHMTGLSPGVKYYVRAYAVNNFGIAYGNLDSLFTATTAFITTIHPTSVKTTSAISGGFITDDGNDAVYTRGICWSSHPDPTTGDSYIDSGSGIGSYAITINGLMGSTKYYVRAYAINNVGIAYGNLDSLKTSPPVLEKVTTTDVINIGGTTALGRGKIENTGGALVTERGFCWNTTGTPDTTGTYMTSGSGNGSFSGGLTGLTPNTTYYVRAYAVNSVGTSYGNEIIFSTFTIASLITTPATSITSISARSGGDIISDGGALVYSSGICWNTTGNPTIYDAGTNSGLGIGNFIHNLNGLMGSTTYYIRAYAINDAGTAYGNVEVFTTSPPVIPTLTTRDGASGANGKTGYCGGTIYSNGGALINTEGVVWSLTSGFNPDTVLVNKTVQAGSGNFNSTLNNLQLGTTYYVRAYASNSAGTGYAANEVLFTTFNFPVITTIAPTAVTNVTVNTGGIILSNGGTAVEESGLCWSTGNMPDITNEHFSNGPGIGLFSRTVTELLGSTLYYLRSYAINSVGITYGQVESFTTNPPQLATIYTIQPVATTSVSATSGGNITSHGGSLVTSRGIYWSTQQNFNPDTITLNKTAQTGYYKGSFNASLTGLTPNTVYFVKAYVMNAVGTSYGEEMSFKTPTLATLSTSLSYSNGPTRAVSGGVITNDGGAGISSRGVVWSTVASFDPATETSNRTYDDYGSGSFVSRPSGLKGNTIYYIMAYATNIAGTSYGNLLSFITDPAKPPNLTTRDAWYVYGTSAVTGGYVSDNGGEPITTHGVVWGTSPDFREDTVVVNKTVLGVMGVGNFSTTMTGLKRGTTYYVKAYARNSIGTGYGELISFRTLDFASLTTMPVSPSSTGYEAGSGGTLISDGGAEITNQGVCWSLNPNPTVGLYTKTIYDNWSGSNFYSNLASLTPVTTYYVRAYAINREGAGYGNEVSFTTQTALPVITTSYATQTSKSSIVTGGNITFNGGAPVTERGVIWSFDAAFNPDTVLVNKTSDGIGNGKFNSVVTNMSLSISYYIRAYAVNSAGTSYGNQIRITLFPTAPVLNTVVLNQITGTTVMSGGEITSDGGAPVTLKGLCWNTSTNPIDKNSHTSNGSGTDAYAVMISGLLPNTLYYVRAYAVNSIGTAYGIERTFQTNGIPTLTATTSASNIIATTATSGGEITDNGRSPIITRGICWSTYSNPSLTTPNTNKTIDNSSDLIGAFTANMKGLTSNTTYYVRAYATNAVGTGYGSQIQFTTFPIMLATVYTLPPTNIDSVKATSGGNIFDDGGVPITGRGICWSNVPVFSITVSTKVYNSVSDTGVYVNNLTGLSPGIKYYVRAFAINSKGTAYGNLDSLITRAIHCTVSNVVMSNMTQNTAIGSATVITTGGSPVTERGLCWNTTGSPDIDDDTLHIGTGIGSFADTLRNLVEGPTYYVRAYAITSAGVSYSALVSSFKICPSSFTVLHYEGLNGSPVTKTVTYSSVSTNVSGAARCWITQNLGADHQGVSATDGTEASAGWYWQFNRMQGYQYTASRYPTTWNAVINESSNWMPENDPCNLLLGNGWRIPTTVEWTNADGAPQNWNNYTGTYNSDLKLHAGGYLINGAITTTRGTTGEFWTGNQISATNGGNIGFNSTISTIQSNVKATYGFSLRCLRDSISFAKPTVSIVSLSTMTKTTAVVIAAVTPDGGSAVTSRGFYWNTTGIPLISDNPIPMGAGTGIFTDTIRGLSEGITYYIGAYATNSEGTTFSPVVTAFKVCPSVFSVQHVEGLNGAPVSKTVVYHSVSSTYSGSARCWITQNLGADQEAVSVTDATEPSAGWYWQFNRLKGYQYAAGRIPTSTWTTSISEPDNWVPETDPCNRMLGGGWRIPSSVEWTNVDGTTQNWTTYNDAFSSPLKLHNAGNLTYSTGVYSGRGTQGNYWGSTSLAATTAYDLQFQSASSAVIFNAKSYGFSLRCLRDTIVISTASVSNVTFSGMTLTSSDISAIVTPDGGSAVTERGFCWNTTGNPTISDNKIANGADVGNFTSTITGLVEGPTYYVRGYALNGIGLAYSTDVTSFRVCPPVFTVQHIEGIDGAPVTKKVSYHSVSSMLSGKAVCWLTQNLGADSIASSNSDATEASGGWYWQFNRIQGFKNDGIIRTPATSWISISESSNWSATNDPCARMLGNGWRIPTNSDWVNVIANGNLATAMVYNSPLKMHVAGNLDNGSFINKRGISTGYYWSNTQSAATTGYSMYFSTAGSATYNLHSKSQFGFSIRCLRDTIVVSQPSVGGVLVSISSMTGTAADVSSSVGSDGGAPVSARGFCWNTKGNPTLSDNYVTDSSIGTGNFTGTITGLTEGPKYYVRAYATNSAGTTYGEGSGFSAILTSICPDTFNIQHTLGFRGAPVTKSVTYHAIGSYRSGSAKCWLAQNLGADRQATSAIDATEASGGWYFQFNHSLGYKNSGTTTPVAWIGAFNEATDWTAMNDPCAIMLGADWRLPTSIEWTNVDIAPQTWTTHTDAYNSELKLHNAGYLALNNGSSAGRGTQGNYWSSTRASNTFGYDLQFAAASSAVISNDKAYGFSVRCLREGVVKMPPTLSNVVISSATMTDSTATGSATVIIDGGSVVTSRGICWNTTGNPTISDTNISGNLTDTIFSETMSGLIEGPTYYVRAYAGNKIGVGYSALTTTFKICPQAFNVLHSVVFNGVPLTKSVTYHSVNSSLSGSALCWLTQNLGADRQASAATDTTSAAAGWYWQFNRIQGFKANGAVLTPSVGWVSTAISESANWTAATDPCNQLLSSGWRIPTSTEWSGAVINGGWGSKNAYASELKLHFGGQLKTAALADRGNFGYYWSSMQTAVTTASDLEFSAATGISQVVSTTKSGVAKSLRCLRDNLIISPPSVSPITVVQLTDSIIGSATVTPDGGAPVTARGICWGTQALPTITDNVMTSGTGVGNFVSIISGLKDGFTYNIRAFATNSAGTTYSPNVYSFKICNPFKVVHVAGSNGAPVSKTVTYSVVSANITNKLMCWLAQNLGADKQAVSATDASETAAGWYFQFNRVQGYKHDGTTRTPNAYAWTTANGENSGWSATNDPCTILLSGGWRLPTSSEWTTARTSQGWTNYTTTYNSLLKIHAAGFLTTAAGALTSRGSDGMYWSSTQNGSNSVNAYELRINTGINPGEENTKTFATSVRCLRDTLVISVPTLSNVDIPTATMTSNSGVGNAAVSSDGSSAVTERGLVWNTTGTAPTIADNKIIDPMAGMGTFSDTIAGLKQGPVYYVRAYAVNAKGTAYSPAVSNFKICPTSFTVMHVEGMNGAPVTKTVTYHSISTYISGGVSKCWLTQNLGATGQSVSATDNTEDAAGWYFQFNRSQGYQFTTSRYPVTSWIAGIGESASWSPANDPCTLLLGNGWRLPIISEWQTADASPQNWGSYTSTYNSVLKIHAAGWLSAAGGALTSRGSDGMYWSSTQNGSNSVNGYELRINTGINPAEENNKAIATPVRCLLDISAVATPSVSNVLVPAATITSNSAVATANISADGGTPVTDRGFVWNTTGTAPTIADTRIVDSSTGIGSFSTTLTGLMENKNYYIRAYAINAQGIIYSLTTTQIKICNPVTVVHVAGSAGSPVSRTITYPVVSANVTNKLMCWLGQNLGAEQQAASGNDGSDAAAGWYFQFNRVQGYATSGTTRTPNAYAWTTANGESSGWTAGNDPCAVMIGQGWRLPTNSEWSTAAAAPRNWANYTTTFNSALKIHAAGFLIAASGALTSRGTEVRYASSNQNASNSVNAYMLYASSLTINAVNEYGKADALSVRCLRDTLVVFAPTVSNVDIPTTTMTSNSGVGNAAVSSDGGSAVTERGLVWNTTGTAPTIANNKIIDTAGGMGTFSDTITGLIQGPVYYVRAYAVNAKGITYSPAVSNFKICPTSFTVMHVEGMNGAPVTKSVTYHSISTYISGGVSKCWLTQNLGATGQAVSATDNTEDAAGWYFQFNRAQGYQFTSSRYPVTSWIAGIGESANWSPANDPCTLLLGNGWRLPIISEWQTADASPQNWGSYTSTYNSVLKIHAAGWLSAAGGALTSRGSDGMYWSSSQNGSNSVNGYELRINTGINPAEENNKAIATPVRCLLDISAASTPSVSNVLVPAATITSNSAVATAYISTDGGTPVTERGFVWNTTGITPTIVHNRIVDSSTGLGSFSTTLTGLTENKNYYIRAYAINAQGITYSLSTTQIKICNPVTVVHVAGSAGSPVSRTITYPVVSANVTNKLMCWLGQNLGAEQQATSGSDGSDAAAGWYFQFNRVQGYATSGTIRTPNAYAWTTANGESLAWAAGNDPCAVMIGQGWRLPTNSEWSTAAAAPQNWINYSTTYSSVLKIHAAGFLIAATGVLTSRGTEVRYASSNQNASNSVNAYMLYASSSTLNAVNEYGKADALSVRCLRDTLVVFAPTVSNVDIPTATMTSNSGVGNAAVSSDGGSAVTERGLVWNTTGTAPTVADNKIIDAAAGMGTFSDIITGLKQGPVYYVRAYAVNTKGTTYSPAVSNFKICPTSFTVMHVEGMNGAPVTKTVTYHSISTYISGGVSKCWLTQNLGADQQATSVTDATEASAGWYFQFNRSQGYQFTTSRYPLTSWIAAIGESASWSPVNDPCTLLLGNGWRLPIISEWQIADASPQNWSSYNSTYNSVLKIHAAGWLSSTAGASTGRGSDGMYWSSSQNGSNSVNGYELRINTGINPAEENTKSYATPVRCLLDISTVATPAISNVLVPAATITYNSATASANISTDGGTTVTERGFVWNTTGTAPTIADNKVVDSSTGIGLFSTTLTGLTEINNYYIRAYAINAQGIVYSLSSTQIKMCNPVTVVHVAGSNGAPVTKTVTYSVVSSNVTNKLMCWLAQNLGADQQAASANDGSEASAGWYFQFNRVQGYRHDGTTRTPNASAWTTANGENSGWTAANDPCVVMIGQGWRLPIVSEWQTAAAAPRNWANYNTTFSSALKIHAAGWLSSVSGALTSRGTDGMYWSSTQNGSNSVNAYELRINTGINPAEENTKTYATPVRCIRDVLIVP